MNYIETYEEWKKKSNDEERRELESLSEEEIKERFSMPLGFGTAGMRGIIGAGLYRMNVRTVGRAGWGLAKLVKSAGAQKQGVVVSYDTRNYSFEFALRTAEILASAGIDVKLFEDVRPVPVCSFAVRYYKAYAGVMITASHNPKEYNGYKVYGSDGAQMSLEDTEKLVDFIEQSDYFDESFQTFDVEREFVKGKDCFQLGEHCEIIGKSLDEAYYNTILKLRVHPDAAEKAGGVKIVYTPIHGAGQKPVCEILKRVKLPVEVVEEQKEPDGNFPTVIVPNPEQSDALKMGIALAQKTGAEVVIGTDPDCDRMGIAIKEGSSFTLLNGNAIGTLLCDYILNGKKEEGTLSKNAAVIKTIVTSELARKVANDAGAECFDVLTGFKFIGEKIKEWEKTGEFTYEFGFEESYGSLSGTHARDKDAVVASMLFAEMVCYLKSQGKTVSQRLGELYEKFGYYLQYNESLTFPGLSGMETMKQIMAKARALRPNEMGGKKVALRYDYLLGEKESENGNISPSGQPKTDAVKFVFEDASWLALRPSGTEPKMKIYVEAAGKSRKEAENALEALAKSIKTALGV